MNKPRLLLGFALLALLSVLGWYLHAHLEWQDSTKRSGYSKEALRNEYHAGMLLLTRLGYPAEASEDLQRLDSLPIRHTLFVAGTQRFADPGLREKLLSWVARGGHLALQLDKHAEADPLLTELKLVISGQLSDDSSPLQLKLEGQELEIQPGASPVFYLDASTSALWQVDLAGEFSATEDGLPRFTPVAAAQDEASGGAGQSKTCPKPEEEAEPTEEAGDDAAAHIALTEISGQASLYARFRHGKGFVTLGDFSPFTNPSLGNYDHAAFFVRLLSLPQEQRPVLMLFAPKYPGLLAWLIEQAPEALLGLTLLLAAGLWRVAPRFGPLQPDAEPQNPGLGEHLAASGHFLLKHRAYEALIAALREDVLRQLLLLQHRHPEIEGAAHLGAHISGLKAEEIARALSPEPDSHHEFLRRCQTLVAVRDHCQGLRQAKPDSGALS